METVAPDRVVSDLTEADLIGRIKRQLPTPPTWLIVGIGDDAAVVEAERNRLEVLTVDALVEGVHFDRTFTPPEAIGHRALAVNLSDLAAMGATPRAALLSFALPRSLSLADFDGLVTGLTALASRYRITVVGGNLTCTPGPLVIDVTATGTVKRRQILTRAGAQPGDELYVSGTIGAAAAGLQMLRNRSQSAGVRSSISPSAEERCVERYLYPDPRVRLGTLLARNRVAAACIDLSDGLSDAVRQLAEASGLGAMIDASALPIEPAAGEWFATRGADVVDAAITGGDDYELLIAVRPKTARRLVGALRQGNVQLTRIGSCTADRSAVLRQNGSNRPLPRGYAHFR